MEQKPYNIEQAAKRLGLAARTLRRYIQLGRLKHLIVVEHEIRPYRYLTEASITTFLAEYERTGGDKSYYKRRERKRGKR